MRKLTLLVQMLGQKAFDCVVNGVTGKMAAIHRQVIILSSGFTAVDVAKLQTTKTVPTD